MSYVLAGIAACGAPETPGIGTREGLSSVVSTLGQALYGLELIEDAVFGPSPSAIRATNSDAPPAPNYLDAQISELRDLTDRITARVSRLVGKL